MTEAEWLECADAEKMLTYFFHPRNATSRKLRLFACASWRYRHYAQTDEQTLAAVETSERFADGLADEEALLTVREAARHLVEQRVAEQWWEQAAAAADARDCGEVASRRVVGLERHLPGWHPHQCQILRDIFGNPFRPVTFEPSWRTLSVVRLAQTIYDERSFSKMPDLGDALERSGCRDEAMLNHCREHGEHVRGCWVLDLVLGKE